ncbi:MAG: transporter substrate-binding domain-containing protein [Salibacteraceae bacterium]
MIKNWHLYFFIGLFSLACTAEIKTPNGEPPTVNDAHIGIPIDSIIKKGRLIAIVNNTPTSYFIYRGRPMGFQYDLLSRFCHDLGVELEVKKVASIPDAVDSIKNNKADILASGLTVLGDRKKEVNFSIPITQTHQILVQRKPDGYQKMSKGKLEKNLLRDVTKLANQEVYVEEGSSYYKRLINLQNEIGDSINIITYDGEIDIDSIMSMVSIGKIKYAVTDEYTAKFFLRYFPNIDILTPVSFNQNIAWAVSKSSIGLQDTLNKWILKNQNSLAWAVIYNKYFKHNKNMNQKAQSSYNIKNGKISPYDDIIKEESKKINWDWKLIAAQISVESGFKPNKTSWAGAQGLMQIMPATAAVLKNNEIDPFDPKTNIEMGIQLNGILFQYWINQIQDSTEAIKFSLASYNIGRGHVYDAQRLAEKYGLNPHVWDGNVAEMIVKLSKPRYYKDSVVRHGYCRGIEAFKYVSKINSLYHNYNNFNLEVN